MINPARIAPPADTHSPVGGIRQGIAAALLGLASAAALAGGGANLSVGVVIEGEVHPGVYGRVEIGNRPPPPILYPQPVVIVPTVRPVGPIYLHVPPGHARKWSKHCHKYEACGVPVYFVRSSEYDDHGRGRGRAHGRGDD
jgi:hypothetical protein